MFKSDTTKFKFLLESLLFFYSNKIDIIGIKDYGNNDTTRKLRKYIISKKSLKQNSTEKDPIVQKLEPTKGKRYNYYNSHRRLDREHVEENCQTKARDEKMAKAKVVKQAAVE